MIDLLSVAPELFLAQLVAERELMRRRHTLVSEARALHPQAAHAARWRASAIAARRILQPATPARTEPPPGHAREVSPSQ